MAIYKGKISSGLRKSQIYLEKLKPLYSKIIGDYYPGTLNVISSTGLKIPTNAIYVPEDEILKILNKRKNPEKRKGVHLIRARIFDEDVFVIQPENSDHPFNVLEIIAKDNLKRKYNLKDGDEIEIHID